MAKGTGQKAKGGPEDNPFALCPVPVSEAVIADAEETLMSSIDDHFIIHCPSCGTANRVPAASEGKAGRCGACHAVLPPLYTRPVTLTDRSFDAFVDGYPGPVLAEFWAPW